MKEVTKEQFYAAISKLNVAGTITNGRYPYVTDFRLQGVPSARVIARAVGKGDPTGGHRYYLPE